MSCATSTSACRATTLATRRGRLDIFPNVSTDENEKSCPASSSRCPQRSVSFRHMLSHLRRNVPAPSRPHIANPCTSVPQQRDHPIQRWRLQYAPAMPTRTSDLATGSLGVRGLGLTRRILRARRSRRGALSSRRGPGFHPPTRTCIRLGITGEFGITGDVQEIWQDSSRTGESGDVLARRTLTLNVQYRCTVPAV